MNKKDIQLTRPPVPYQVKQFFNLVDLQNLTDQDWRWLNNLVEVYRPLSDAQWAVLLQGRRA